MTQSQNYFGRLYFVVICQERLEVKRDVCGYSIKNYQ